MFYRMFWVVLIAFSATTLWGQNVYEVVTIPNPKDIGVGYVSDPDDVIAASDESQLNNIIRSLEDSTTAQVAVVVVNSIGEKNPKDFATELFRYWGIGQASNNNGLLVFTVMDQRRTEFETGYGLEGVLPDAICYRVGMQQLVPYFRSAEYGAGLIAAVNEFKRILEQPDAASEITAIPSDRFQPQKYSRYPTNKELFILVYLILLVCFHIHWVARISMALSSREELYDRYVSVRKIRKLWACFVFPLPYIFIYRFLNRRMHKLRYAPRYSRETGVKMVLLDEKADDEFLTAGQIMEEEIGSVDYDVWRPDDESDTLILRYDKRFSKYKRCPSCSYKTYYHARTHTVQPATYASSGKMRIEWFCKNCAYEKVTYQVIPKLSKSSSSSFGGSSGGGSSWGGGSSGGGSSWGGGSSGGGGAGVSW